MTCVHSCGHDGVGQIGQARERCVAKTGVSVLVARCLGSGEQRIAAADDDEVVVADRRATRVVKRWSGPSRSTAAVAVSSFRVDAGASATAAADSCERAARAVDGHASAHGCHDRVEPAGERECCSGIGAALHLPARGQVGTRRTDHSGRAQRRRRPAGVASRAGACPAAQPAKNAAAAAPREPDPRRGTTLVSFTRAHVTRTRASAGSERRARDARARSPPGSRSSSRAVRSPRTVAGPGLSGAATASSVAVRIGFPVVVGDLGCGPGETGVLALVVRDDAFEAVIGIERAFAQRAGLCSTGCRGRGRRSRRSRDAERRAPSPREWCRGSRRRRSRRGCCGSSGAGASRRSRRGGRRAASASSSPGARAIASAVTTPQPPAVVSTAVRGPRGSGWVANVAAASNASSTVAARVTPAWRHIPSKMRSSAARLPV